MHEINPADAQRIDDRGVYAPLRRDNEWPARRGGIPACTANRCSSGDKACPCPDACLLTERSAASRVFDFLDRVPVRHFWLGYAAFLLACAAGLHLIFN